MMCKKKSDFLTTGSTSKASELLKETFSDNFREPVLLFLISVSPREKINELLFEQDKWIKKFWMKIVASCESIHGCRVLWDTLFFFSKESCSVQVDSIFERILKENRDEQLQSKLICRVSGKNLSNIISDLDEIQLETSSSLNWGELENVRLRLIDGKRWPAQ